MVSRVIPVDSFDLVIFGGTGDLARRKILPGLYRRFLAGQMTDDCNIIGAARSEMDDAAFRAFARGAIEEFVAADKREAEVIERFLQRLVYVAVDAKGETGWAALGALLRPEKVRAFYFSVAPSLFGDLADRLHKHQIAGQDCRIVVEKPFGRDLASARALNAVLAAHFGEHQIYRIDHYLGKETVQNLMAVRFANILFEPIWNAQFVDHVQITVAETVGVNGRGSYYDKSGAMRDMVQNHLMQLVCLIAMEPPYRFDPDAVRDEKLKVLKALEPIDASNSAQVTVRGQYRAGASAGGAVPGYLDELGADRSDTETFVALKAEIGNWRWSGVPFYLRTGKRLASRVSEIVIQFRPIPHSVFDGQAGPIMANRLVIRLQPDEGVKLWIMIKDPGPGGMRLTRVPLDMSFADAFEARNPDAYERLLLDVVRGNATLFMRRDEVEAAWSWIDPIRQAWDESRDPPKAYTAGTWGPSAAIALIERDGRTWHEDGY